MQYISNTINAKNKEKVHRNDVKLLFINASISYRLNPPRTLSYSGPHTQLQTTRPLRT